MKLSQILNDVGVYGDIEITSLAFDTSEVKDGSLFFCLSGSRYDGHEYISIAKSRGAVCAVVEKDVKADIPIIQVPSTRKALALCSGAFYGNPSEKLTLIGVTGTNGKTSTSYMIKAILEKAGYKTGMIGTNGIYVGSDRYETKLTTPDPIEYNAMLALMVDSGVKVAVSEVSAHSLALNKVDGIKYDIVCFTNFTRDHLDFFGDMEEYKKAKLRLFGSGFANTCVVNADDETGREIARTYSGKTVTYGIDNPADVFAVDEEFGEDGVKFVMNVMDDIAYVKSNLCGRFNVYNIMCASAVAHLLGISVRTIEEGIRSIKRVDGRFNIISAKDTSIIIDFAHTDDGLKNAISSIREFSKGRIITVFGCGGDRDKAKRPLMGEVATELSDFCIITSDNPRSEKPIDIVNDIKSGIKKDNYEVLLKRKEAIRYALNMAQKDDIIFIAGKGAEQYQEIDGIKYEYNDEKYIMELIKEEFIV
ncbi:MAG: UDP-N-acetylmuramoyl-L-alanyl-D-glutamate--2,6-diaminopimelate ligase [Clostridia bacterium]|nr:UDP-N-acetylmuramoyl-L-alanyl-D-glutamate--2,6-diaminopimelate ligase [Clostridia bacterium]